MSPSLESPSLKSVNNGPNFGCLKSGCLTSDGVLSMIVLFWYFYKSHEKKFHMVFPIFRFKMLATQCT